MDLKRPQRILVVRGHEDDERQVMVGGALDDIEAAYDLFGNQRDDVVKVALYPAGQ